MFCAGQIKDTPSSTRIINYSSPSTSKYFRRGRTSVSTILIPFFVFIVLQIGLISSSTTQCYSVNAYTLVGNTSARKNSTNNNSNNKYSDSSSIKSNVIGTDVMPQREKSDLLVKQPTAETVDILDEEENEFTVAEEESTSPPSTTAAGAKDLLSSPEDKSTTQRDHSSIRSTNRKGHVRLLIQAAWSKLVKMATKPFTGDCMDCDENDGSESSEQQPACDAGGAPASKEGAGLAAANDGRGSEEEDPPPNPKFNFPPKSIWDSNWIRGTNKSKDALTTEPTIANIKDWKFDPLLYKDECLQSVFPEIIRYYKFDEKFNIPMEALRAFSAEVMKQHNDVVYHNWFHIVSVLHITFMMLEDGGGAQYLHDLDIFAVLFAAFIHDVDHTGRNNDYENKRNTELSKRYNQQSVLENNSLDVTWTKILSMPGCNVLASFDDVDSLKEHIKEIVLLTDVAKYHGGFLKSLTKRKEEALAETSAKESGEDEKDSGDIADAKPVVYFDKSNKDHRLMLCQAIIKAADISNPILSNDEAVKDWCLRISTEFKGQVDKEREQDLKFVPFMDVKDEYEISKSQVGFYSFMVIPYFNVIGDVLPKTKFLLEYAHENLNYYKEYIAWVDMKKSKEMEEQWQQHC